MPKTPRITKYYLESLLPDDIDRSLGVSGKNPPIQIKERNGWIEVEADDMAAARHSQALNFIMQDNLERAKEILLEIRERSPQFFAARFNLGRIYLYYKDHQNALNEFTVARNIIPQYWKNYYYLGKAYELQGEYNAAIYHYHIAYLKNPYDLGAMVALGDLMIAVNRYTDARHIYKFCLANDSGYNDALIGMGKIAYHKRNFYDATVWFRNVDLAKPYKKELHYYDA